MDYAPDDIQKATAGSLDLVPTRLWEAMREGGDDLRHIATLEAAIVAAREQQPDLAAEAEKYLVALRSLIRDAQVASADQPAPAASDRAGADVDLDTGLVMGEGRVGSAEEAPLINALATRFSRAAWQQMRDSVARYIVALRERAD